MDAAFGPDQLDPISPMLRGLHAAATLPDVTLTDGRTDKVKLRDFENEADGAQQLQPQIDHAEQLLFALRANPTLGRLFRFVVDLELPISALTDTIGGLPGRDSPPEDRFFLTATMGEAPPVWSVTSARFEQGRLSQVWPALRADMELSLAEAAGPDQDMPASAWAESIAKARDFAVAQQRGLVRLGQGKGDSRPWQRSSRYELATSDAAFAAESDLRNRKLRTDLVNSAARQQAAIDPVALARVPGPSLVTRGLVVLDRWRQSAVVAEIATAHAFCKACTAAALLVVNAEDLATGFTVHVEAPSGRTRLWRSQMNRRVAYRDPRQTGGMDIEAALLRLGLPKDSPRRLLSDAASVTVPSRSRQDATGIVVHVEEALTA